MPYSTQKNEDCIKGCVHAATQSFSVDSNKLKSTETRLNMLKYDRLFFYTQGNVNRKVFSIFATCRCEHTSVTVRLQDTEG